MKPIIGIFGSDKDLTNALDELYRRDFDKDNIKVVEAAEKSPTTIPQAQDEGIIGMMSVVGPAQGPQHASASNRTVPAVVPVVDRSGSAAVVREDLLHMGVPRDEVEFYVQRLEHGNKLVVLEDIDEARAESAKDILRQAQATNL